MSFADDLVLEAWRYEYVMARINRGCKWLDMYYPGWEHSINLGYLNLQSPWDCICGQVGKKFLDEFKNVDPIYATRDPFSAMTLYMDNPEYYGFEHSCSDDDEQDYFDSYQEEYSYLAERWIEVIKDRFDTGRLSGNASE